MSASTTISEETSVSSEPRADDGSSPKLLLSSLSSHNAQTPELKPNKKRNKPGNPDPNAEVVALSPRTLTATNRYACDACGKGFQREQNLQLHRRGHNLPWKLRQSDGGGTVRKKVYVCPEATCAHHHPSRALGDLTGIKKHFWRKHGDKRWTCERCSKKYAVMSDWKAHAKTCGTREYRCDCGAVFSRKDSFSTHRAFCDALAEESARIIAAAAATSVVDGTPLVQEQQQYPTGHQLSFSSWDPFQNPNPSHIRTPRLHAGAEEPPFSAHHNFVLGGIPAATLHLSAGSTALLHTSAAAARPSETTSLSMTCTKTTFSAGVSRFGVGDIPSWQRRSDCGLLTRDFLGKAGEDLLSVTNSTGGSVDDFMASAAAASCGCLGDAAVVTTETKPEAPGGLELRRQPNAASSTAAPQAWWRMLQ